MLRAPPDAADLAVDEKRARPDARRPETFPPIRVRDEQLPRRSLEQEVGVAARQESRGRGDRLVGADGRFVLCEQPFVAERRPGRQELVVERRERLRARAARDAGPAREPLGGRRAEDVEVAARELAGRVGGVDVGCGDGPA